MLNMEVNMENPNTHNRLVADSNPAEPTKPPTFHFQPLGL